MPASIGVVHWADGPPFAIRTRRLPRDGIEFSRFVSFLDGGTVVALTLLAVSVLPQSGLTDNEWHKVFAGIMNGSHATFVALVVCFVIVTSFWLDQHHLYSRLRGIDRPVILLNLGYLFLLTLAPVVAVALAEHRRDIYAIWLYVYWATLLTLVSIAMPWLVGRRGCTTRPTQRAATCATRACSGCVWWCC